MPLNKKGAILRFIPLVALLIFIMYIVFVHSQNSPALYKGGWQLSALQIAQDAQKELLLLEQATQEQAQIQAKKLVKDAFNADLGCGTHKGIAVVNSKNKFCFPQIQEEQKKQLTNWLKSTHKVDYDVLFDQKDLVGKAKQKKKLVRSSSAVEESQRGVITTVDYVQLYNFYTEYSYFPHLRFKNPLHALTLLEQDAKRLVTLCSNQENLEECLDTYKPESFAYSLCSVNQFTQENRKVIFCSQDVDVLFAIDFTPTQVQSVRDVVVSAVQDTVTVTFTHHLTHEYKLYYTNWQQASTHVPNLAQDVFSAMPTAQITGNMVQEIDLDNLNEDCTHKQLNQAYVCAGKVMYSFTLAQAQDYYFAVASQKEGEEAPLVGFVRVS